MKRLLSIILTAFALINCANAAIGETFSIGNFEYTIISTNEVKITRYNCVTSNLPVSIPTNIEYNSTSYIVTAIGDNAFSNCTTLTNITIPSNITSIGNLAFAGCNIKRLKILSPDCNFGNMAFGYSQLEELSIVYPIPNLAKTSIKESDITELIFTENAFIPAYRFKDMPKLKSLVNTENIKAIGADAFESTQWRANQQPTNGIIVVGNIVYKYINTNPHNIVNLGTSIFSIADNAFENQTLEKLTWSKNLKHIGNMAFKNCTITNGIEAYYPLPNFDNIGISKNAIKKIYISSGTTEITNEAFSNCGANLIVPEGSTITTDGYVSIPEGVIKIGKQAFSNCHYLKTISLPSTIEEIGNGAFVNCTKLTNITISAAIKKFPKDCFKFCNQLSSVLLSNHSNFTTFEESCFEGCNSITTINCDNSTNRNVKKRAFYGCQNLESINKNETFNIDTLGEYAFYGCKKLDISNFSSLSYPVGVFEGCEKITTITIGQENAIGEYAFKDCIGLKTINLSANSIGDNAFNGCDNLEQTVLTINSTITSLNNIGLKKESISKVTIGTNITTLTDNLFRDCINLGKVKLSNVMNIGNNAFSNCTKLDSISFSANITTIGNGAFSNCSNLASVVFENKTSSKISTIEARAFRNCTKLTEIELPNSITIINAGAFSGCNNLKTITLNSIDPPFLFNSSFTDTHNNLVIKVPANSVEKYKKANNWSEYNIVAKN